MIYKQGFGLLSLLVSGLVSGGVALGSHSAFADGSVLTGPNVPETCSVPVCNIDEQVEKLKRLNENQQFNILHGLRSNSKSTDLAVLHNIAEFASKAAPVLKQLNAVDWVVGEANALKNEMNLQLAKYSPLNAKELSGYYSQLVGESARYEIFKFWRDRVGSFEDKDSLMELITFFAKMGEISTRDNDPEYIAKDARSMEGVITVRIVQLYPYFEGTYRVSVHCELADSAAALPSYCKGGFINRLVIMDTMDSDNLEISLSNKESGLMLSSFTNVIASEGLTAYEAISSPSGVPSKLHLNLDRQTGKISGWVRNTDTLATLVLEGERESGPSSIYDLQARGPKQVPLTPELISRSYRGQFSGRAVTFTMMSFGKDLYGATMAFDGMANYRLRFQTARFYPKLGMMVMIGKQPNGSRLKLTMYMQNTDGVLTVTGFGFTDYSAATQELSLTSVQ